MTISSSTSRWAYDGNGSTDTFAYTTVIYADTDLKVYVDGTLQTKTTHYSVTGVGNSGGGSVVFVTAPASGTKNVVIERSVPQTQPTEIPASGPFPSATIEQMHDRAVVLVQQLSALLGRMPQFPISQDLTGVDLALPAPSASTLLGWNAAGDGLELYATGSIGGAIVPTVFMATLLDDVNASAALTTLGVSTFIQTLLDDVNASAALTTLGVSAFIQTLLDDASASAARTTLGLTDPILDKASPGAIGGTTPAAGSFTTLTKTSAAQAGLGLSFVAAYRSAGTENVSGNGTAYTITWNTELVDRAGDFASNTFTARYTGWHRVNVHLQAYNMTTSCTGYTVTAIATAQQYDLAGVTPSAGNAANQARIACSKVLYMTAGDTLYFTFTASGEGSDVVDLDGGKKWSGLEIEYLGA